MSIDVKVQFAKPQQAIGQKIRESMGQDRCTSISIVVAYFTEAGLKLIEKPLHEHPTKLKKMVIGCGNRRAYEGCDRLLQTGVDPTNVRVALGFSAKPTNDGKSLRYKHRPMLHSKVYLIDMDDGNSIAFVGSHNLSELALSGLNGEMSISIEGPSNSEQFEDIRRHIDVCYNQAVPYQPSMKGAYVWWAKQYCIGLEQQFKNPPNDFVIEKNIVVLAQYQGSCLPSNNEVIYFEIPEAIGQITSLRSNVHLFLFEDLPATPIIALDELHKAKESFKCEPVGVENEGGGVELIAKWEVTKIRKRPALKETDRPFRPELSPRMQQVRVKVNEHLSKRFKYLFELDTPTWKPSFNDEEPIQMSESDQKSLGQLKVKPPVDVEWCRVSALEESDISEKEQSEYHNALEQMSPTSGNYILMSLCRRRFK